MIGVLIAAVAIIVLVLCCTLVAAWREANRAYQRSCSEHEERVALMQEHARAIDANTSAITQTGKEPS